MHQDVSSWIVGLMKTESEAIGFIPSTSVRCQYISKGRYILQRDEYGRRVGYILHGAIKYGRTVVISQAVIDYDKRLKGYGEKAANELICKAQSIGASSITLRCASDLPAICFWQSLGFQVIDVFPGGKSRNRMIVKFVRLLPLPLLIEW